MGQFSMEFAESFHGLYVYERDLEGGMKGLISNMRGFWIEGL